MLYLCNKNNANSDSKYIIFSIKDTDLYVPVATFSTEDNKKLPKFISKRFDRRVSWNEYKTKGDKKNTTDEYIFFSNQTL